MSKKMRAFVCVLLSTVLMLSMNVWGGAIVSAEETAVQPRLSYTNYVDASLSFSSTGTAYCIADVQGYQGITTSIHIKMELQKYTVLWWSTEYTWEGSTNGYYHALSKSRSVSSGKYRVKVTATVYSGSNSEEVEVTTKAKTYSG